MEHLKDLNVVITAAASGIGVEIAKILMKNGSNVIVCDKDEVALKRLNNECPGLLSMNIDHSAPE